MSIEYGKQNLLPSIIVIILLIMAFYSCVIEVRTSRFICNNTRCEVQNKNFFGFILHNRRININDIRDFEITTVRRRKYDNYYIWAVTKDLDTYKLFESYRSRYTSAEQTVEKLREAIKTKPVNIDIIY